MPRTSFYSGIFLAFFLLDFSTTGAISLGALNFNFNSCLDFLENVGSVREHSNHLIAHCDSLTQGVVIRWASPLSLSVVEELPGKIRLHCSQNCPDVISVTLRFWADLITRKEL